MGAGGALLIPSLFMPWAEDVSGWELLTIGDVFLLIAAAAGGNRIASARG